MDNTQIAKFKTDERGPRIAEIAEIGTTCRKLRQKLNVDLREFVMLGIICESHTASLEALSAVLELSYVSTDFCLRRLIENQLIEPLYTPRTEVTATFQGRALMRNAIAEFVQSGSQDCDDTQSRLTHIPILPLSHTLAYARRRSLRAGRIAPQRV